MRRGQGCAGEVHRQRWVRTRCTHTHVYVSGTRETTLWGGHSPACARATLSSFPLSRVGDV